MKQNKVHFFKVSKSLYYLQKKKYEKFVLFYFFRFVAFKKNLRTENFFQLFYII